MTSPWHFRCSKSKMWLGGTTGLIHWISLPYVNWIVKNI